MGIETRWIHQTGSCRVTYDLNPIWGTHTNVLERALAGLPSGALVIEHGAGVYSTPLIARFNVRVICIEELEGWRGWSNWFYQNAGLEVEYLDVAKRSIPRLAEASLVFIDGVASQRGDLLGWAIAAKSPLVIGHDTDDDSEFCKLYGYQRHMTARGYEVTHDGSRPRTTIWRRL